MTTNNLRTGLVIAAAAALLLTACGSSSHSATAAAPTTTTAAPTTTTTVGGAKPYDPTKPIDLSGTPGVTNAEQTRAETLVKSTLVDLKRFEDPTEAYAAGYRSIGDGITGDEHYVNWSYVDDGHILDANKPESIVYENRDGKQEAVAAMYMLPFGSKFTDVPDVGGPLTQWHVHQNLCLTNDPTQKVVAGLTTPGGGCRPGTSKAGNTPMLHVWTIPNRCGPFAALEGIGGGEIAPGETRLCDTAHGAPSN